MRKALVGIARLSFTFLLFSLFTETQGFADTPATAIGKVMTLQGKAWTIRSPHSNSRREILAGSTLYQGENLRTGEKSSAQVLLGKTVALLLKEKSDLNLTQTPDKNWMLHLRSGALYSAIKNPKKIPNHFRVRTRAATLGARGTSFFFQDYGASKPMFFCPCMGEVTVTSLDEKTNVEYQSKSHDAPKVLLAGDARLSERIQPASQEIFSTHSDEEEKSLKALLATAQKDSAQ